MLSFQIMDTNAETMMTEDESQQYSTFDESYFKSKLTEDAVRNKDSMLEAVVTGISNKHVIVDARRKAEHAISITEFKDDHGRVPKMNVGDVISVRQVMNRDTGEVRLSHAKAKAQQAWPELEQAHRGEQIVQAIVLDYNKSKSYYTVGLLGAQAILPRKAVEASVSDPKSIINHKIDVRITKMDERDLSITVSQRLAEQANGNSIIATVKSVEPDKAILSHDGKEYTLLVQDYSWEHVTNLCDKIKVDQPIKVRLMEDSDNTMYASVKQLFINPWLDSIKQAGLSVGDSLLGRVVESNANQTIIALDTEPVLQVRLQTHKKLDLGKEIPVQITKIDKRNCLAYVELIS